MNGSAPFFGNAFFKKGLTRLLRQSCGFIWINLDWQRWLCHFVVYVIFLEILDSYWCQFWRLNDLWTVSSHNSLLWLKVSNFWKACPKKSPSFSRNGFIFLEQFITSKSFVSFVTHKLGNCAACQTIIKEELFLYPFFLKKGTALSRQELETFKPHKLFKLGTDFFTHWSGSRKFVTADSSCLKKFLILNFSSTNWTHFSHLIREKKVHSNV